MELKVELREVKVQELVGVEAGGERYTDSVRKLDYGRDGCQIIGQK